MEIFLERDEIPHDLLDYFEPVREDDKSDVWRIATRPFSGAHFATYPPALVEPCILAGTSAKGACPECGAPWERVVEREGSRPYRTGKSAAKAEQGLVTAFSGYEDGSSCPTFKTLGWQPTCDCDAGDPIPQIVLDPFSGAGTTCMVADRLKRHWFGIDISEEYCEMARERIRSDRLGKKIPDGQTTIFDTLPFPV